MSKLHPPTSDAIERALWLLLENINDQNRTGHSLSTPATMLGTSERLEARVEVLRMMQKGLVERLSSQISKDIAYRNSITSIVHRLPLEIFSWILILTKGLETWDPHTLRNLAMVSGYWFNVVMSTPQLWAVVKYDKSLPNPLKEVYSALQRSQNSHLTVTADSGNEEFFEAVGLQSKRWRSIRLTGFETAAVMETLQLPCPALESLHVRCIVDSSTIPRPLDIAYGTNLRHLHLDHVGLRWDVRLPSSLRSLHLCRLGRWNTPTVPPTVTQILTMLGSSPDLERLSLQYITTSTSEALPTDDDRRGAKVALPRLQSVELRALPFAMACALLTRMEAEHVMHLTWIQTGERDTQLVLPANPIPVVAAALLGAQADSVVEIEVKLTLHNYYHACIATEPEEEGSLRTFRIEWEALGAATLIDLLGLLPLDRLSSPVNLAVAQSCRLDPLLFHGIPTLRRLTLAYVANVDEILETLSHPLNGGRDWHCAELRHLVIKSTAVGPQALIAFLEARYRNGGQGDSQVAHPGEPSGIRYPRLLETLIFPVAWPTASLFMRAREILGLQCRIETTYDTAFAF